MTTEEQKEKDYDSSKITVLEGLEAVRNVRLCTLALRGFPGFIT